MSSVPVFVAATQGTRLVCLALMARGGERLQYWVPQTVESESSWQATTPGHGRQQTEAHPPYPCLSIQKTPVVSWCSNLTGRLQGWHTFKWPTELLSRNVGRGRHLSALPLPRYSWLVSPRKGLIHSREAPVFATAAQGSPPDHLPLVATRVNVVVP